MSSMAMASAALARGGCPSPSCAPGRATAAGGLWKAKHHHRAAFNIPDARRFYHANGFTNFPAIGVKVSKQISVRASLEQGGSSIDPPPTRTDTFESSHKESADPGNASPSTSKANEVANGEPCFPTQFFWLNNILAGIGIADTAYLTYEKLTGGSVFCPLQGSCNDVLNSPYGSVFGLPLSLFGLLAYSLVPVLTFLSNSTPSTGWIERSTYSKWALLGLTSVMTSASAYFTYIMLFELHETCPYCILSALLSSALLFSSFKALNESERKRVWIPQAGVVLSTLLSLSLLFSNARFAFAGVSEYYLPYSLPQIDTISSLPAVQLAKHLTEIGGKMYGAFWCSHCNEQKRAFGEEAARYLNYVECFPEGYASNIKMRKECLDANIQGFPTWIINEQVLPGEQDLDYLAEISGFYAKYYP